MPRPVTRNRRRNGRGWAATALIATAGAATGVGGFHAGAAGQATCRLVEVGGYTLSARNTVGSYTHYASGGVDYRCADGVRIVADSAVGFETNSTLNLYGRVRFEDLEVILEAGQAIYFGEARYLRATHGSRVEYKNTGTVVAGEELDYYRQSEHRAVDEMTVRGGRPHATVYPQVASEASREEAPPAADPPVEEASSDHPPADEASAEEAAPDDPPVEASSDHPPAQDEASAKETPPDDPPVEEASSDNPPAAAEASDEEARPDDPPTEETSSDNPPAAAEASAEDILAEEAPSATPAPEEDPPADLPPAKELPPYEIDAERFVVEGRRAFRAVNDVVLVRDALRATGDTLFYDQESGAMSMRGEPRVGDGRFDLEAESISITPASPGNENILASGDAALAGAAVAIEAPAIRLFLEDGDLGRLVALATAPAAPAAVPPDTAGMTPGDQARVAEMAAAAAAERSDPADAPDSLPRPAAYAEDLTLVADSIEVLSPGQVLRVLTAVGTARAVAVRADSADQELPEVARNDWMEGDTIVADFVPPGPGRDGGTRPRAAGRALLETLVAAGSARSLYRVPPDTTIAPDEQPTGPPPLHWTQGQRITMHLADGEVVRMLVEGQTVGYHLEPLPPDPQADSATVADSTSAADSAMVADTTAAADSAAAPDTTAVSASNAAPAPRPVAAPTAPSALPAALGAPRVHPWRRRT